MTPAEFDELLLGFRIYVRDYDVGPESEAILAALEEAGASREVGGQVKWQPEGWDEEMEEPPDGGAAVAA